MMAEKKLKLKLLVDSKTNKVVYAEAGKEFVDFLFHILSLPVGTVVQLLNVNVMAGCIGSLYKSVEYLDFGYFQPNVKKDVVLKTKAAFDVPLLKLNAAPNQIYKCCSCFNYASAVLNATCPGCRHHISKPMTYVVPSQKAVDTIYKCCHCCSYASPVINAICPGCGSKINAMMTNIPSQNIVDTTTDNIAIKGYVKDMVPYMVTDNLEVKPLSTIAVMNQMNKFNVKDVSALTEKEVEIGFAEGLAILKASFEVANTALTTVFLSKKEK